MKFYINNHELAELVGYISNNFDTFAAVKQDGKVIFDRFEKISDLAIKSKKTIIPFKKILYPNNWEVDRKAKNRVALIGLKSCDIQALHLLLDELKSTAILPEREDVLIVGTECVREKSCFCYKFGADKLADFDLYIQEEKKGYSVFSGSKKGNGILKQMKINDSPDLKIREIENKSEKFKEEKLFELVEAEETNIEFWQGIANNCFGCGACTAVCPLCFCTRQEFTNDLQGNCKTCLRWDSCFAKRFSEIQNHYDFRPKNADRLYNWYHHKFVRAKAQNNHFLCVGCGRCIDACPAHLNIKNILNSLIEKNNEE